MRYFQRLPPLLKVIYMVSEFRSTMLCHCCFQQLEPVRALTPRRVYRDAERRRAKWEERWGPQWVGRPVPEYTIVSRLQRCDNPECPVGFVHRDKHPPLAMIENAISLAQGPGGVRGVGCTLSFFFSYCLGHSAIQTYST